jgi:hypothetical protein
MLQASLGFKGEPGVSPTLTTSKSGGTTTITITDVEGTKTATILDGEITEAMIVDDLTHNDSNKPLSAKQGKVLKGLVDAFPTFYSGTTDPASGTGANGDIYFKYEE